jgi:hypothetical protein
MRPRRAAVVVLLVVVHVGSYGDAGAVNAGRRAAARPFGASSPWYQRIPRDAPSGPGGYAYGQEIAREIARGYKHVNLNRGQYAPAVYTVGPDQPRAQVSVWNCQHRAVLDAGLARQLEAVPVPDDAVVPPDLDAHLVVWQPSSDTVWEMWKTRRVDGQWQACWGGRIEHASVGNGTFAFPYGATGSGISLLAGLLTVDDLRRGRIDHALAIGVGSTLAGRFSWPANRTDGRSSGADAIPVGQRLRLDPNIDVRGLGLSPLGTMVARALQRYGAIVRDTTIGAVVVYAQYPTGADTAASYEAFYGGTPHWAQFDKIPWDRLQAMPDNYGRKDAK